MNIDLNLAKFKPFDIIGKSIRDLSIPVSGLSRDLTGIKDKDASFKVSISAIKDAENRFLLNLRLTGSFLLECTSCAQDWQHEFDINSKVELLENDSNFDDKDLLYESVLMSGNHLNLLDVLADELILSLPKKHKQNCEYLDYLL